MNKNNSTLYVDITGNGILQPLPKRGELSRKILAHIDQKTKDNVRKSMTCKHLYDCNRCRVGELCEPDGCEKWEYNTKLKKEMKKSEQAGLVSYPVKNVKIHQGYSGDFVDYDKNAENRRVFIQGYEQAMAEIEEKIAKVKKNGTWDGVDVDEFMREVRGE